MRNQTKLVVVGLVGCLVGCGDAKDSGACADSPVVGTWKSASQTINLTASCTFSDDVCGHVGTFPNVTSTIGTVKVSMNFTDASKAGCLPTGDTNCSYDVSSGTTLLLNCGAGQGSYTKQ